MEEKTHIPVLLNEVLSALEPKSGGVFLDGTVGHGGHAEAILKRILPKGRLLAIDRDERNLEVARKRLAKDRARVVFVKDSYANALGHAERHGFFGCDGILLDLGFSSAHVDDASRGFSFLNEGPLDMRYDQSQELTAADILNSWTENDLAAIFRLYGEEPEAARYAKTIAQARRQHRFATTMDLAAHIELVTPRRGKIHPATRVFQALRIVVNEELAELERALPMMVGLLKPGGRLAIITFHSLEDRIVKQFFQSQKNHTLKILNKHVIAPSEEEQMRNPRSRSAKLRAAEKI